MDQEVFNASPGQQFGAAIQSVTFADRVQVQLDRRVQKAEGRGRSVQFEPLRTDTRFGFRDLLSGWELPLATEEPPGFGKRSGSYVKGTTGLVVEFNGPLDELEQPPFDWDGAGGGRAIDRQQFAARPVHRHLRFQFIDEIQGGDGCIGGPFVLAGIEKYVEVAGHGGPTDLDEVSIRSIFRCGDGRIGCF
jgi:hypothetical protein